MLSCSAFIEEYSDYRDGLMDDERSSLVEHHLRSCVSCARYHRVLIRGVRELRSVREVEASPDFLPRLQHRLYHLHDEGDLAMRSSGASLSFVMLLVTALALAAWLPLLREPAPALVHMPPITAAEPIRSEPLPTLFRTGPFLDPRPTPTLRPALESNQLFFRYARLGAGSTTPTTNVASSIR